ncbi:hypothetical protein [Zymobacter sp. IVIA_12111.31 C1]
MASCQIHRLLARASVGGNALALLPSPSQHPQRLSLSTLAQK